MILTRKDGRACSFCFRNNAVAMWGGDVEVYVCRGCSLDVLPALMADAQVDCHVPEGVNQKDQWQRQWDVAEGAYWKTITSALSHRMRKAKST